jgi:tRNA pseudouridine55 synthase
LQVKAGTYIRAFARDLGRALGFPAHLSGLVRTRAGNVGLELAIKLADLAADKGLTMTELLPYPTIELSNEDVARVKQGQRLSMQQEGRFGLISKTHDLIAIAEVKDGRMKLLRVWN